MDNHKFQGNNCIAYIEIRFSYSPSYRYKECIGLAKKIPGFIPIETSKLSYNALIYTHEQIKEYDIYFDYFIERVLKLMNTKVYFKGVEVDNSLLHNLRWEHRKKVFKNCGLPFGIFEEFLKK